MTKIHLPTLFTALLISTSIISGWFVQSAAKPAKASGVVLGTPKTPAKIGYPSFMSPHSSPIALNENRLFVVNTPSDTVDVINTRTRKVVKCVDNEKGTL